MTGMAQPQSLQEAADADVLKLDHVFVTVGKQPVLRDISMELPRGQITALVGPSGSGKSSLLRVLNRLWDGVPRARVEGAVWYGDTNLYDKGVDVAIIRSHIGMVFQRPTPFPKTIFQNIALPLSVHGVSRAEIPSRVEAALKTVGLWNEVDSRLHTPALTLSGGQQQRLCIARALAIEPDVLLMDEPASALDPKSRRRIDDLIRSLRGQVTVLIVTHHLDEARAVSDRLGVLVNGRLEDFGPTEEVFDSQNETVRRYLLQQDAEAQ